MTSTSPLRTGVPACVMGLLREEAGSQHLAMSQRSPQFSQALNEFCSGLIKCYEDAHLDYKEEIAALFDKAEDESDRSATEAPAPAQPFVPDPTQSPQVNALREQSHRVEQEISATQHQLSERRDRDRDDDSAARRLGDVSAIVHGSKALQGPACRQFQQWLNSASWPAQPKPIRAHDRSGPLTNHYVGRLKPAWMTTPAENFSRPPAGKHAVLQSCSHSA
jgi:hypothetical protein